MPAHLGDPLARSTRGCRPARARRKAGPRRRRARTRRVDRLLPVRRVGEVGIDVADRLGDLDRDAASRHPEASGRRRAACPSEPPSAGLPPRLGGRLAVPVRTAQMISRSSSRRPPRLAPCSRRSSAALTIPGVNPTISITPSATSPASSIALGPDAAIGNGDSAPRRTRARPARPGSCRLALQQRPDRRDRQAHLGQCRGLTPDGVGAGVAGADHALDTSPGAISSLPPGAGSPC